MKNIKLYTVSEKYIDYLSIYAPHLFHNKKPNQIHKRVYIGVILKVNGLFCSVIFVQRETQTNERNFRLY